MSKLETLAEAAVLVVEIFELLCVPELSDRTTVEFNNRFTSRGGDALYRLRKGKIRLSGVLWADATQQQRRQTVIHEACHIVQRYLYTDRSTCPAHGIVWQRLMRRCGVEPKRCHDMDTTPHKRKQTRVAASCICGTVKNVGPQQARKMMSGKAHYTCKKCRTRVVLEVRQGAMQ